MIKYFVLFLPVVFINLKSFSQSQDSLIKVYNNQTIYRFGNKYIKGGEKLTYRDLRLEFNTPSTQEMYKKSKRRLFVSRILNVASLGLVIASVVTKTDINGSIKFAVGTGILGLGAFITKHNLQNILKGQFGKEIKKFYLIPPIKNSTGLY